MYALEVKNVTKNYSDFSLENISFSLPRGMILGLIGENGAGKSTLINLIMNSIKNDFGEIKVLGIDNKDKNFSKVKNDIGIVLDEAYFPEVLNALNVNSIMKKTYINWDEKIYLNYLNKFNVPKNKKFKEFSKGMKMKLSISVALSHHPKLLVLDEATSGLDPVIRDEILEVFNNFTRNENHSILISSHILSDLEKICDYIAFISNGKLLLYEEKDKLLEDYAIVNISIENFESLPKEAIISKQTGSFGIKTLVKKSKISKFFTTEHTTLEDIILFLVKGENCKCEL